jgi:hypothetical protein
MAREASFRQFDVQWPPMKTLCLAAVLVALPAFGDIIPQDVALCRGKSAGAACVTEDGLQGTCTEISISRPDYSGGVPPTYKQTKVLSCQATAKGSARVSTGWLGAGLAFLARALRLCVRTRSHHWQGPTDASTRACALSLPRAVIQFEAR